MDIAKNLANLRKDENLTQEQMAEKLHMSKNGYAKLERGESRITVEHLQNIANTFNIDIEKLLKKDRDFNLALGDNNIGSGSKSMLHPPIVDIMKHQVKCFKMIG